MRRLSWREHVVNWFCFVVFVPVLLYGAAVLLWFLLTGIF